MTLVLDRPVESVKTKKHPEQLGALLGGFSFADFLRADMAKGICSVEGCERPHSAHGWCGMHAQRAAAHDGNALYVSKYQKFPTFDSYLESHTDRSGGPDACWPWDGATDKDGYAINRWRRKTNGRAHRAVYAAYVGPLDDDQVIDHTCHIPSECISGLKCPHRRCVNPRHMEAKSPGENNIHGRMHQWMASRTHCKNGHSFGPDGDWRWHRRVPNTRVCLVCVRINNRRAKERYRQAREAAKVSK